MNTNKPLADMTRDELRDVAKTLELPGYGKFTKSELLSVLQELYRRAMTREAVSPMPANDRTRHYLTQTQRAIFTPRQKRRFNKKFRRSLKVA